MSIFCEHDICVFITILVALYLWAWWVYMYRLRLCEHHTFELLISLKIMSIIICERDKYVFINYNFVSFIICEYDQCVWIIYYCLNIIICKQHKYWFTKCNFENIAFKTKWYITKNTFIICAYDTANELVICKYILMLFTNYDAQTIAICKLTFGIYLNMSL